MGLFLDIDVAKIKFNKAVSEINGNSKSYEKIWKLRNASYPQLVIDIFDKKQNLFVVLLMNLSNWDFLPPATDLLTLDLKRLATPIDLGINNFNHNRASHLVFDPTQNNRAWFCLPGFMDYHMKYWDDRWENIRYSQEGKIINLIELASNTIREVTIQ